MNTKTTKYPSEPTKSDFYKRAARLHGYDLDGHDFSIPAHMLDRIEDTAGQLEYSWEMYKMKMEALDAMKMEALDASA